MNKRLLGISIILLSLNTLTQCQDNYFSGHMDMKIETSSKSEFGDRVVKSMPLTGKYLYSDGAYKQVYSGGGIEYTIYPKDSEYAYTKFVNSDTLFAEKVSILRPFDENPQMTKINKSDTVLNLVCDRIILTTDFHKKTFVYNNDLKIDGKLFIKYVNDNRDIFAKESNSLPLKYIYENKDYQMIVHVTSYKKTKVDLKEFDIPRLPIKYWD